ncbi:MAG: tetratricopeptide repeat protein, partial [Polyangiaceae bacterium]|nr:tetratricopeptide repeat protein [Polyangiaceae bacterium]
MMRLALLVTSTYQRRPDLPRHAEAEHDERAVRDRLSDVGYDFEVISMAAEPALDVRIRELLQKRGAGGEDAVLLYVSGVVTLDPDGVVLLEVEPRRDGSAEPEVTAPRLPLSGIRAAVRGHGLRGLAIVLDLVYEGEQGAILGPEIVAAVRRGFAPELSACAVMCSARPSIASSRAPRVSPLTALWLRTMDKTELQNKAGVVLATRVMEAMREDPELCVRVPCFSLIGGRRDLTLYSVAAASHSLSVPPPPSRASSPASVRPSVRVQDVLVEADVLLRGGRWNAAADSYKKALLLLGRERVIERADVYVRLAQIKESQGRRREAMLGYDKALGIVPNHAEALRNLAEAYGAEGDFAAAACVRTRLLEAIDDQKTQFGLLLALASDCERAAQPDGAIAALERARVLRPEDTALLARLAQICDSTGQFNKVVDIKVAIAELKAQDEEVARSLMLAADFAADRAQDMARALLIYGTALDRDPLTPRAFDAQCEMLVASDDLGGYERAMVAQAARLDRVGAHAAEARVWREVATLRRQQLDDLDGAISALDRSLVLVPNDVEVRV